MSKAIFVTATDTGIGKTTVSSAIASLLKKQNKKVAYFKPVETGCNPKPQDAKMLSSITGQSIEEVVLYTFRHPVAPYVAEQLEGKKIHIKKILEHFHKLKQKYQYIIVEGAGGVCVPITRVGGNFYTYLNLIKDLNIPALVVSRAALGTINHTCMTVELLKQHNIEIKGIILNLFEKSDDVSQSTNPDVIEEMTGLPVIAKCEKMLDNPSAECVQKIKDILDKIFSL